MSTPQAAPRASPSSGRSLRIGIVGLGTIGRAVARALAEGIPGCALSGVTSRDEPRARRFLDGLTPPAPYLSLPLLVQGSDLVVEAATQAALLEFGPTVLDAGRDLLVLSVGALLDRPEWSQRAAERGCRIHVPSAAIAGLDGLKGAAVAGHLASVVMETRKPPRGLAGAPGVAGIDLEALRVETLVFEGTAREACRAFPANVNVVAAVSLAGLGPDRTLIRVYAVPGLALNRHLIMASGEFGHLRIEIENVPSDNPRTGKLSYLSTVAYLHGLGSSLRIGT